MRRRGRRHVRVDHRAAGQRRATHGLLGGASGGRPGQAELPASGVPVLEPPQAKVHVAEGLLLRRARGPVPSAARAPLLQLLLRCPFLLRNHHLHLPGALLLCAVQLRQAGMHVDRSARSAAVACGSALLPLPLPLLFVLLCSATFCPSATSRHVQQQHRCGGDRAGAFSCRQSAVACLQACRHLRLCLVRHKLCPAVAVPQPLATLGALRSAMVEGAVAEEHERQAGQNLLRRQAGRCTHVGPWRGRPPCRSVLPAQRLLHFSHQNHAPGAIRSAIPTRTMPPAWQHVADLPLTFETLYGWNYSSAHSGELAEQGLRSI